MENDALIRKRTVLPRWPSTEGSNCVVWSDQPKMQGRSLEAGNWELDDKLLAKFRKAPNPSLALELKNGAEMLQDLRLVKELDTFLEKFEVVDKKFNIRDFSWDLDINDASIFGIQSFSDSVASRITRLRRFLRLNPYASLVWLELGRHYVQLGHYDKAAKSCDIARGLSPDNVFILRSAIRCYAHIGKLDKALSVIEGCLKLRNDPWILPSRISIRHILGKSQEAIKTAQKMDVGRKFSDGDLSEIRATLGMISEVHGNHPKAKKHFRDSLKQANENSISQVVAMGFQTLISETLAAEPPPNSYEASARLNYKNGSWEEALKDSLQWLAFEPYSGRPAILGSFIAQVGQGDHKTALDLLEVGIRSNPEDLTLKNNKIFSLACSGELEKASSLMELAAQNMDAKNHPALRATEGLICYRRKEIENGRELYHRATEEFLARGDKKSARLALVFQAGEELRADVPDARDFASKIHGALKNDPSLETRLALHRLSRIEREVASSGTGASPQHLDGPKIIPASEIDRII